ncbi:MAG TPA: hypothetical protein VGG48_18635 [Rhizomicrobium sp.]|jgi:hypothetical protein
MKKYLAAAVLCAVVAGPTLAFADTPNGTTGTSATTTPVDPNEVICKRGEVTTGSRFPGPPICHTRLEWEQEQRNAQESLGNMENRLSQDRTTKITGGH